jgi:hypothetical protein
MSLVGAAALVFLVGCSSEDRLPQSPSPIGLPSPPAQAAPASVTVQSLSAFRESVSQENDAYYVAFALRELGGRTGATIKAIELAFANGVTATFGPEVAATSRVGPGATVLVSEMRVAGARASRAGSVQIRVLLTDDNGGDSVLGAATGITATYRLSGRVTESGTGRAVAGATVTVTFGAASGRIATSDATGSYAIGRIPVGSVSFTVAAPGFTTATRTANVESDTVADVSLARIP